MVNISRFFLTGALVSGLLFSAVNVFAGPLGIGAGLAKPTKTNNGSDQGHGGGQPEKTPGAKATEKAEARATDGKDKTDSSKKVTYKGTVTAASATTLTLAVADGSSIAFTISSATQIKISAHGETVTVGAQAQVQAQAQADGSWLALHLHIVPGQPEKIQRVGVVTAYIPGLSITILAKGHAYTFALAAGAKILPSHRADQLVVGAYVTIISRRDPAGGPLTAQGVVVHPSLSASTTPGTPTRTPTATQTPTPTLTPSATPTLPAP